jgi:hypothetical protein
VNSNAAPRIAPPLKFNVKTVILALQIRSHRRHFIHCLKDRRRRVVGLLGQNHEGEFILQIGVG